jgi:hypothetical protein
MMAHKIGKFRSLVNENQIVEVWSSEAQEFFVVPSRSSQASVKDGSLADDTGGSMKEIASGEMSPFAKKSDLVGHRLTVQDIRIGVKGKYGLHNIYTVLDAATKTSVAISGSVLDTQDLQKGDTFILREKEFKTGRGFYAEPVK